MSAFETLAAKCAAGVALDLLVAIASLESGIQPLSVRDGGALTRVASAGEGVAIAIAAADQGRDVRIGLMGLTEQQLRAAGMTLAEGFEACASLTAAARLIEASRAIAQGQSAEAADRAAIRAWWRQDRRFTSIAAFEAALKRERSAAAVLAQRDVATAASKLATPFPPSATAVGGSLPPTKSRPTAEPDCWDVFARQRAGFAQCGEAPHAAAVNQEPRVRHHQPEPASVDSSASRGTPR